MQSYRELVRFTGELDWKRERRLFRGSVWRRSRTWHGDSFDGDCFNSIIPLTEITRISKCCVFRIISTRSINSFEVSISIRVMNDSSKIKSCFRDTFPYSFKGRNTLIALTRVICLKRFTVRLANIRNLPCVYTGETGGEKGKRVVWIREEFHGASVYLSELSRNSWKTRHVRRGEWTHVNVNVSLIPRLGFRSAWTPPLLVDFNSSRRTLEF